MEGARVLGARIPCFENSDLLSGEQMVGLGAGSRGRPGGGGRSLKVSERETCAFLSSHGFCAWKLCFPP